ncbi:MAG: DUF1566 domain-containing protein [Balneolaceae bacterium]|nr:DUF1566 domain-containing protein [Balneolaceae bacterium]
MKASSNPMLSKIAGRAVVTILLIVAIGCSESDESSSTSTEVIALSFTISGFGEIVLDWDSDSDAHYNVLLSKNAECDWPNANTTTCGNDFQMKSGAESGVKIDGLEWTTMYMILEKSSESGSVYSQILPVGFNRLNDTGIDWCSDNETNKLDCPVKSHPMQDGDFGRDAASREGKLLKAGEGDGGFDFTKLDEKGNPLPASSSAWRCVRDNHTGLVWEAKTPEEGLHYKDNLYSWYVHVENGDSYVGVPDGGLCTGSDCDTSSFVKAVNQDSLCGREGWRLPTVSELINVLHLGRTGPSIDKDFFPNTASSPFWTSMGGENNARYINFQAGAIGSWSTSNSARVRLVVGEQPPILTNSDFPSATSMCTSGLTETTPSSQFTLLDGGEVARDETTGLEWRRCTEGTIWSGTTCEGFRESMNWEEALQYSQNITGWRMPTIKELHSILERCTADPYINQEVFPDIPERIVDQFFPRYWSATPDQSNFDSVRTIQFQTGNEGSWSTTTSGTLRLVRDAE